MTQRTTMVLLLLLVIGVWVLLLRPAVTPLPVQAQGGGSNGSGLVSGLYHTPNGYIYRVQAQDGDGIPAGRGLLAAGNGLYLYSPGGNIYHFGLDLKLLDRAFPGEDAQHRPTYTFVHEPQ